MKDEPAFPSHESFLGTSLAEDKGMTIFQYASIAAMQGLLANPAMEQKYSPDKLGGIYNFPKIACDYATVLIAEMERRANDKPKEG